MINTSELLKEAEQSKQELLDVFKDLGLNDE